MKRRVVVAIILIMAVVAAIAIGLSIWLGQKVTASSAPPSNKTMNPVNDRESACGVYHHGAVAADDGRCSSIGKMILFEKNGSAVDAAIATMLCIGVINCHSAGIGGGAFMTVYDRASKMGTVFDYRETAPAAADENMYSGNSTRQKIGGLAIAVPGEVRGFWSAHQRFGRLAWKELFEPSIKLCRDGYKIGPALGGILKLREKIVRDQANLRELFVNSETGELLTVGKTLYRPKLARTLTVIANEGPDAFYDGSLSQDIIDDVTEQGGILTRDDLRMYSVKTKQPLVMEISGLKLYSPPPPSSGAILQFILNTLEGYGFDDKSLKTDPILTFHRIVEAFKFGYSQRQQLGDEDFLNISTLLVNLTSEAAADNVRSMIWRNITHYDGYYGELFDGKTQPSTSHSSTLAPNGDAVSVTSTVNYYFGSKVRGTKTGIIFNNEMADFSIPNSDGGTVPFPANSIRPGKRPLSSMVPSIFVDKDGDVKLVVGASGSQKIISAVALVSMRSLFFGNAINESIDARRIHHQMHPPYLYYENGFPQNIVDGLKEKGHNMTEVKVGGAVVQGILVGNDAISACSDFRKGGRRQGYPDGE